MDVQEKTMEQGQRNHSYENAIWCNVYDWQVTPRENHETGRPFWDVKLASGTTIEHASTEKGHRRKTTMPFVPLWTTPTPD